MDPDTLALFTKALNPNGAPQPDFSSPTPPPSSPVADAISPPGEESGVDTLRRILSNAPQYHPPSFGGKLAAAITGLGSYFGSTDLHGIGDPTKGFAATQAALNLPYERELESFKVQLPAAEALAKAQTEKTKTDIEQGRLTEETRKDIAHEAGEKEARGETHEQHLAEQKHWDDQIKEEARKTNLSVEELKHRLIQEGIQNRMREREFGLRGAEFEETKKEHEFVASKPTPNEESSLTGIDSVNQQLDLIEQKLKDPKIVSKLGPLMGRGESFLGSLGTAEDPDIRRLAVDLTNLGTELPNAFGGNRARGVQIMERFDQALSGGGKGKTPLGQEATLLKPALDGMRFSVNSSKSSIESEQAKRKALYEGKPVPTGKASEPKYIDVPGIGRVKVEK